MIGTLRFVGLLNAAVWFGGALFFFVVLSGAPSSRPIAEMLGPRNFPYFSQAISSVLVSRYYHFQLVCALIAVLHLLGEWVYFGKSPRRVWGWLVLGLLGCILIQGNLLQPRLKHWHTVHYAVNLPPEQRQAGGRSFQTWHSVSQVLNFICVCGLGFYFWRVANPPDPTRFVSTAKFRG